MSHGRAEAGLCRPRGDARASPTASADERRLVALYLLTVADIRGTSPKVWNAWKAQAAGGPVPRRRGACSRASALGARRRAGGEAGRGRAPAAPVRARRTRSRTRSGRSSTPPTSCATTRRRSPGRRASCTTASTPRSRWSRRAWRRSAKACRCMIYTPRPRSLFARICGFFERASFNIVEAKIHTTRHGYALDTFLVMGKGPAPHYRDLIGADRARARRASCSAGAAAAAARRPHVAPRAPLPDHAGGRHPARRARRLPRAVASSPATAPACSTRIARMLAELPASTCTPPRSTRWATAPRTCSWSRARRSPIRRRCCKLEQELLAATCRVLSALTPRPAGPGPGNSASLKPNLRRSRMRIG